jgi:hypothetical protein
MERRDEVTDISRAAKIGSGKAQEDIWGMCSY